MESKVCVCLVVSLFLLVSTLPPSSVAHPEDLKLVNNGYEGLVVAITDYIPQEHCNHVIHGLKSVLAEFSGVLWRMTGGRASLREVTVALPGSWRTDVLTCSLLNPLTAAATPTNAHITVTSNHPVFRSNPWTQQSQGCGRQGNYIQMGGDLLRSTTNETYMTAARLLLAEWVKFRWGVFDERGYPDDPLYPPTFRDPATGVFKPNNCISRNIQIPPPFCATDAHIPEAPTKHNAQCLGRPAWDIILQSQDFANHKNGVTNASAALLPTLKFVQESAARIVLVVEDTAVMNMQRRWEFVRKAVRRVVVYDVPDGDHVALVVFNSVARTAVPLSKMDSISDVRQRIGSSLPRNPSSVPESGKCVLCGLQEALRVLDEDPVGTAGATIILVTSGKGAAHHQEVYEMEQLANNRGVRIDTVLYPVTERHGGGGTAGLQSLVSATRGSSFTVMDEGVGNDSKVSMMVALMDALLAAVRRSEPPAALGAPVVIHSNAYPGGIASLSVGSFTLDDSLGPHARLSIYYYDLNHVGNTVQLTTPSGATISNVNMQEEDGDANVIFVNIPDAERGLWQYKVENRADSHQGLHIQVSAKESATRKISLRLWTNAKNNIINASAPSLPIIIYAEVKEEEMPIINARVTAYLQRLGTDTSGSNYNSVVVELYDNGNGDPDITGADGIYSRYLPSLQGGPGHYQLSISVDHNSNTAQVPIKDTIIHQSRMYSSSTKLTCCGSSIIYKHIKPIQPFQRSAIYGVLEVVSQPPLTDIIPPSRILDLIASVNRTTREIALRWTAPGDNYDWGRAHHLEAVMANSWAEAKAFDGERISGMPLPLQVGTKMAFFLQTEHYEQMMYVAIRGVDKSNNRGGVSNIATLWIPLPPTTPSPITSPRTSLPTSSLNKSQDIGLTQPVRVAGINLEDIAVILGSVGGFLIIAAVLATFCYCHVAQRRQHHQKQECEKPEGNCNIIIKTNSSQMVNHDDSHDSGDSTMIAGEAVAVTKDGRPLSPIQSWGVTKLLQEHERRVSMTIGPLEAAGSLAHYQNLQEPYPDVTLTCTHPYAGSQTPTPTHSDPPAYPPPYTTDAYVPYPYPPYHPGYIHEDLPPYTPGLSSQSSQASTAYTHEIASQPSEISYPVDHTIYPPEMQQPSFVEEIVYTQAQPPMYSTCPQDAAAPIAPQMFSQGPPVVRYKVLPPVAPKPPMAAHVAATSAATATTTTTASIEPKHRNVTQV